MKVYIAGKITGLDPAEARKKFDKAEHLLQVLGHEAINPMAKASEQAGLSWADYMREDISLLLECDTILLLPDWSDSPGARLEKTIAEALGFYLIFMHETPDRGVLFTTPSGTRKEYENQRRLPAEPVAA